jgi:hypothetical protein
MMLLSPLSISIPSLSLPEITVTSGSGFSQQSECQALDAQIRSLDSMARQPRSGASQDRITLKRKAARDRQSQLGCR